MNGQARSSQKHSFASTQTTHLEGHVEVAVVLEGGSQRDNEGEVQGCQDVALVDGVLNLLELDDLLLLQHLEGVLPIGAAVSDKQHFAKGAAAQRLEQLVVLQLVTVAVAAFGVLGGLGVGGVLHVCVSDEVSSRSSTNKQTTNENNRFKNTRSPFVSSPRVHMPCCGPGRGLGPQWARQRSDRRPRRSC